MIHKHSIQHLIGTQTIRMQIDDTDRLDDKDDVNFLYTKVYLVCQLYIQPMKALNTKTLSSEFVALSKWVTGFNYAVTCRSHDTENCMKA